MYDIVTEDLNNGYKLLVCTDGDQPYSVLAHLSVFVIVNILHIDCLVFSETTWTFGTKLCRKDVYGVEKPNFFLI